MKRINEFLQSEEWRKFQESVGRRTFHISFPHPDPFPEGERGFIFWANIIEHKLPIVGKYFYIPRGPIICHSEQSKESRSNNSQDVILSEVNLNSESFANTQDDSNLKSKIQQLIDLAKKNKAGWIRIEPENEKTLQLIKNLSSSSSPLKRKEGQDRFAIYKAPYDMQPRQILVIDITKPEGELLAEMKPKTRYNIKLSQKRGVSVKVLTNNQPASPAGRQPTTNNYFDKFIELVKTTAKRNKITPHPESYYRKMFETIPGNILKLYIAEYNNKIIAANIVIYYGDTAIYLHGASDNEHRNVMAPYLLQWQAILDAKTVGLSKYDLGGVKLSNAKSEIRNPKQIPSSKFQILNSANNSWQGITCFKTGFAPQTSPVEFPGSYDIIIDEKKYFIYKLLTKSKEIFLKLWKNLKNLSSEGRF